MAWFFPPEDVHDRAAWDHYWEENFKHGITPPWYDLFCFGPQVIPALLHRGATTVLCAGNGFSQEPRALAAAGFHVTAMDISTVALELAQSWRFTPEQLDQMCPKEFQKPGETPQFIVGDLLDPFLCPGPFDAIIERRTLQLFPPMERGAALDALASRLQADGILLSHCHDGSWRPPEPRIHQVEDYFRQRNWRISHDDSPPQGRVAWLLLTTG